MLKGQEVSCGDILTSFFFFKNLLCTANYLGGDFSEHFEVSKAKFELIF